MRTYKPKYRDKKGKWKEVKKYWVEVKIHNETTKRFAGCTDEEATKEIGRNIERLASFRVANLPPDAQLVRWLEQIPTKLRNRLVEVGLLDASRFAATKPLLEHVADFVQSLDLCSKGKHAQQTASKLRKIIEACKFRFWSDVKASEIEAYLADRRKQGLSKQTVAYYAKAFRQFSLWMVKEKRASEVPVIHYERPPKNYGRAFELDEFQKLLDATISGPQREGLSGRVRYVCYILAVETGLRRGELRSLTPASFDFKSRTVFVSGEHTKNGEDAVQEFSAKTAGLLKEFVANKMPSVQLFPLPNDTAKMIRADCKAAGIEVTDNAGRNLTFHSIRHSCGSFLADRGTHPKIIQDVMRHKSIDMTMSRYTHVLKGQRRSAIESMSSFTKRRDTGTA